jgi:hypothetical protein
MGSERKMDSKTDSKPVMETSTEEPRLPDVSNCPLPLHYHLNIS